MVVCFLRDVLFCCVGRCGDDDADDDDSDDDDGDGCGNDATVIFCTVVKCANISTFLFRPSIRSKIKKKKKQTRH